MTFTVLLTATNGGLSAQTVAYLKASERHSLRVIAVDATESGTPVAAKFADAFHRVPYGQDPNYVARIIGILRHEKVDLVLPCSDEEALALAGARRKVEATGSRLACADTSVLELVSDKPLCFKWLAERGFPVPDWRYCATVEELAAAYAYFGDEFVVKPARGRGNRDVYVVSAANATPRRSISGRELHLDRTRFLAEHASAIVALLPVLVSERLATPCFDVDTLSWNGVPHRVVPRQRLNPEGVPFGGNVVADLPPLRELARAIASALKLSWLYDFDVMTRPRDGSPVIIEVNPRPSGSLAACVAAGIPILDDLISLAKGEQLAAQLPIPSRTIYPFTALHSVS
jgi:carbamoyl-phosphate synthase large subunit